MHQKTTPVIIIILITISCLLPYSLTQTAKAQQTADELTLAKTINSVLAAVDWNQSDSWTALWGNIFCRQNMTAFDGAISRDVANGNLLDALYVARLAELNNYTSSIMIEKTQETMERLAMTGSLPLTTNATLYGDPGNGSFLLYYRYLMYCYPYAETCSLTEKWNITQAYLDFKNAYLSRSEMLWIDPDADWSRSLWSRYFDEHAQTLSMFLEFYDLGIAEALEYAADTWEKVQAHWNGQYYGYTDNSTVECEMGNFAQVAAAYKERNGGSIPYWDRVISDLNYKLLVQGWDSPGWAQPGVIVHASSNPQLRLWETTSAVIALQQLYPYLSEDMKANFAQLLLGDKPAWKGLMNSSLNVNNTFIGAGGEDLSTDATVDAAATLFLEGIVPQSGNIAIPMRNEECKDCRTPFNVADFRFDYESRSITIPVNSGDFTFIYGSTPVNYTFARKGIYTIHFSNDWNQINSVNNNGPIEINLTVTVSDAPTLSWTCGGASSTEQYRILRGLSMESETPIAETNSSKYVDSSATNGNIYYYRVETANKTSADVNVVFDYAHVVSAEYSNRWHSSDFMVQLSVPQGSNATICYRINGGEVRIVKATGQPWITSEGTNNVLEYWSKSPLRSSQSEHFFVKGLKLDRTAPAVILGINGGAENTTMPSVALHISAGDISGITQMRFSTDNGQWSSWEPYAEVRSFNLSGGFGVKQVFVEVQNGAGLTSVSVSSIILLETEHAPTTQPTPTPANPSPTVPDYSFVLLVVLTVVLLLRHKAVVNPKKRR